MEDTNTLSKYLNLSLTRGVGNATIHKLLTHFGSIENIYTQSETTLAQIINLNIAKLILNYDAKTEVEEELTWMKSNNSHHIITLDDEIYPDELRHLTDYPIVLYAKGNLKLLKNKKLAIVGTRHPSKQGLENAHMFSRELANRLTIVSGLALGIDKYAHMGALESPCSTIGVIGTGIDQVYPSSNRELFDQVAAKGLILSEYPLKTQPLAGNFPRRNRIIAALSLGCLVIESAIDGGSMITANLALELGREVMAIPGSIHNPVTRGCHKLIKTGAKLIETCNDIFEELLVEARVSRYNNALKETDPVLIAMGYEPIEVDKIYNYLNIEFGELCTKLLELELDGKIINCGNGKYQQIVSA